MPQPKKASEDKSIARGYSLPKRVHGEIDEIAVRIGTSSSGLVHLAVRRYLDQTKRELDADPSQQKAS